MSVYDDTEPVQHMSKVWRGLIAANVADLTSKAYVTIPDMDPDGPGIRIGPCRWQSRDAVSLPVRGDECLVIFDNDNEPWVVAWWPY